MSDSGSFSTLLEEDPRCRKSQDATVKHLDAFHSLPSGRTSWMQDFFFFFFNYWFYLWAGKTPRTLNGQTPERTRGGEKKVISGCESIVDHRNAHQHAAQTRRASVRKERNLAKIANYIFHATHHHRFAWWCVGGGGRGGNGTKSLEFGREWEDTTADSRDAFRTAGNSRHCSGSSAVIGASTQFLLIAERLRRRSLETDCRL